MQSFTAPEIAALISAECIIVATREFSQHMESDMEQNQTLEFLRGFRHWVYSVHLITGVEEDEFSVDCGSDHVHTVNLMQPIVQPKRPHYVEEVVLRVCAKPGFKGASCVQLSHYIGGPCNEGGLSCCIVFGGGACGWTVKMDLGDAIELAHSQAVRRGVAQGMVSGGQTVRISGLQATPELNGELGIALSFNEENGRWLVRLRNGEGKQLKPTSLEGLEGKGGRVLCFWGDARWSRSCWAKSQKALGGFAGEMLPTWLAQSRSVGATPTPG
jgi:hypothetical protein